MKKILFSAIAAIGLLLSPGCSDENEVVSGGNDSLVSFSVGLENGIQTKAISDGTTAKNLVVGVYENIEGEYVEIGALRRNIADAFNLTTEDDKPKAEVTYNLVKGKTYSFIFWAQSGSVENSRTEEATPYDLRNLQDIKVSYDGATANDENRDAFVGVVKDFTVTGKYEQEVKLKRPFAQLNFLVTQEELQAAQASTNFELKRSQITLSQAAQTLHPFTNTVENFTDAQTTVTFKPTAIPMLSNEFNTANSQTHPKVGAPNTDETYYYLATTYFLVPKAGTERTTLSSVNLKLANDEGTLAEGPGFTAHTVPVQWNYRTNIYGNLLTADGQFTVEIVPDFNTPDNNQEQPQTVMVATVEEVNAALANGATSVTVQKAPTAEVTLDIPKRFATENEETVELTIPASEHSITISYNNQTNAAPKYVALNVPNTQNLTINLEYSTVTLNGETYNQVTATTWDNTLIVPSGTTIQTLHVVKGNVEIYGTVNNITKANDYTGTIYYYIAPGVMQANEDYYIKNAQGLQWLASTVNAGTNFSQKTVKLANDIDLNNQEWTPIGKQEWTQNGKYEAPFQGTFDGDNHTISNLKITSNKSDVGLFGLTKDGEVKNFTLHNASVSGYLDVGAVAGTPYTSKYTNIKLTGVVKIDGYAYVGGMFGKNAYANLTDLTIDVSADSYVNANSEEYRTYVGGLVGFMGEGNQTVSNVTSNINVTGSTCDVGGITGIAHYSNTFENCTCTGNVTLTGASYAGDQLEIGGIAGVWHNQNGTTVTFRNCKFTGTLKTVLNGVDCSADVAESNKTTGRKYSEDGTGQLIIIE